MKFGQKDKVLEMHPLSQMVLTTVICLLWTAFVLSTVNCAWSAESQIKTPDTVKALHRLDFHVAGNKCPACLKHIASGLVALPGVVKADVSIFTPYAGVVIYDEKKTTLDKIRAVVVAERAQMIDQKDVAISKAPEVIIPQ